MLAEHLRSSVHEICGIPRSQSGAPAEDVEAIGIADAISVLPIRILLAFRSALDQSSPATLPKRLAQIRWTRRESIYRAAFRSEEVKQLEWLQPRIWIEIDIHGKAITPVWYQQDLVAKSLAKGTVESTKLLVEDACTFFQHWSEKLIESDRVWQAAAVLSRYHEYLTKLETNNFRFFQSYFEGLITSRHLSDLPWPEMDAQALAEHLQANLAQFRLMIASHIALLLRSQKPFGAPDYLGQFIHATAENMFNALIETKPQDVRLLLRPYLSGCFSLFEKMKPAKVTADVWFEQQIQVAVAPILDLLELSGYAKLLSELSADQDLWLAVTEVWDQLLGATPEMLPWLAVIVQAGTPRFQIPHRGLVRTRWSMRIRRELERLPRKRAFSSGIGGIFGSESIDHQSALVRYCAKYQHYNGKNIFAYAYLAMRPGGDVLEWGRQVREFADSVNREERTHKDGEGENETQA